MYKHFLYRHIRLDINKPFYIGVGTKPKKYIKYLSEFNRAFCVKRSKEWDEVINTSDYEVEILLESNDYSFLLKKEIEFITLYGRQDLNKGTLVNLTDGGEGAIGCTKLRGIKKSPEHKAKLALLDNLHRGRAKESYTKQRCLNISQTKIGKLNPSFGKFGKYSACAKAIIQYDKKGNFIKEWGSARDIAKELNLNYKTLSDNCRNKLKTAYGFVWKFKNEQHAPK